MTGPITRRQVGADPMIGAVLDERYRIVTQLGEGGIGRVYVAKHLTLGREVAIKTLLTRYENIPVLKERFSREATALASLKHPNIVTVTDFGVSDGTPYLVMELLEGEDLAALIARGPVPPVRVMRIIRQMVRALAYAHERELVHRDLKPHNVFVRPLGPWDDHVEVLDFGLARFLSDAWKDAPKLTAQGALIGTPAYMAPEQASGQDVDASADVYAAGCVLFEALTGRRVFDEASQGDIIRAHMLSSPQTVCEADRGLEATPGLEALVARCLDKSPRRRFANGRALLDALDALGPEPARRVGPRRGETPDKVRSLAPTQTGGRRSASLAPPVTVGDSIAIPQRRAPLWIGASVAALLLIGIGAGAVYLLMRGGEALPDAPPPERVTPLEEPAAPAGADPGVPPARDPFSGEIPERLSVVHDAIEAGRGDRRAHLAILSAYQRDHADDPLPSLLLGRLYTQDRLFLPAISQYELAYELDPSVRGDPSMSNDLFTIAQDATHHAAADALIRRVWGREAATMLTTYLETERPRGPERDRLRSLRDALAELEP